MGLYLNSKKASILYKTETEADYFVDKTAILDELAVLVEQQDKPDGNNGISKGRGNKYICITRPRRFGKSVMASMIAAYFGKGRDCKYIFDELTVSKRKWYTAHLNSHNVIYITFNEVSQNCNSYQEYITRIQNRIISDLMRVYPDVGICENDTVWDALNTILELEIEDTSFIFILDEWDYIFHQNFITEKDKIDYLRFLSNLLKGQPYVELAYMTGILPIAKYSSGSELNMFYEYTMASEEKFSDYFGFTDTEVDMLFDRYQKLTPNQNVTRKGLREWYDGYHIKSGKKIYNPRSVVASLTNNNLGNYWTSAGPYDEIYYYINHNIAAVRDELAIMAAGLPVPAKVWEYAATSMNLVTKDEILSAMVVYGFLSYEDGYVNIPNRELMKKFDNMLHKESSLGYVHQLAIKSEKMLKATLIGDTATMCEILEFAHNTEIPLLNYNNETDLTAIVNLVYLSARDNYRIEREDKAGIGYVDFIFYPEIDKNADCIILELKIDSFPEEAIQQIIEKKYALRFRGKLGEQPMYTGKILAVGISYNKKTKMHSCIVQKLY